MTNAYVDTKMLAEERPATATSEINGLPKAAAALAYAGALPLIGAALAIIAAPGAQAAAYHAFMIIYGGALLAFFGGVRWGLAVRRSDGPTIGSLLGAAAPFVAAMPMFLPWAAQWKFIYMLIALPVLLIDDLRATRRGSGAPAWYLGVRAPLTMLMEVAYLVAFVETAKGA